MAKHQPPPTVPHQKFSMGDPKDPRLQRSRPAIAVDIPADFQQGLAGQVFGILGGSRASKQEPFDGGVVPVAQLGHCGRVSLCHAPGELFVFHGS
jgi:hypothetical protein